MIDVIHIRCVEINCIERAKYNYSSETKEMYCLKHKKDNMFCVSSTKCIEADCTTRPTYNFSTEKKPIYCLKHKKDDMINVINAMCKTPMCSIMASNKNTEAIVCVVLFICFQVKK
jgi:hypothetical protein